MNNEAMRYLGMLRRRSRHGRAGTGYAKYNSRNTVTSAAESSKEKHCLENLPCLKFVTLLI